MNDQPCTSPHCTKPSVFSTVGLVDGRFYGRCYPHELDAAQTEAEDINRRLRALLNIEPSIPGQLRLVQ